MRNVQLLAGGICLFLLFFLAIAGPFMPFVDTDLNEEVIRMTDEGVRIPPYPPSEQNLFGSDHRGRDFLSLIVIGTKETLFIVFTVTMLRYLIAVPLGMGASYFKGLRLILNGLNYILSFIPPIFLVALLLGIPMIYFSDRHIYWFIFILAFVEIGRVAELQRSSVHHLSGQLFIEAAVTAGTSRFNLLRYHYFPHLVPQMVTSFIFDQGRVLFLMAQLAVVKIFVSQSFISTLGGAYEAHNTSTAYPMLLQQIGRDMWTSKWIPVVAVVSISFMIVTFYLVGEGLKKHLQKKYRMSQ